MCEPGTKKRVITLQRVENVGVLDDVKKIVGDTLARKTDWPNAFDESFVECIDILGIIRRMYSVNVSRSDTLAEICQRWNIDRK